MTEPAPVVEGTPAADPSPQEAEPKRSFGGGLVALLMLGLAKFKSAFVLIKFLPAGKVLLTSLSMIAMIAFESQRSGWLFAVGFVLLILVHELGHGYAMKRSGVEAGWPVFIPFFGAMIAMKGTPRDRGTEAVIAYGGPLAGTAASLLTAGFGLLLDSPLLVGLAYAGFFLNLFNMTPMSPLDGGRVAQAFSKRAWILGLLILGAMALTTHAVQLYLIGALGLSQLFRRDRVGEREALSPELQGLWALRYFGLCAFLAFAIYFSGRLLGRA